MCVCMHARACACVCIHAHARTYHRGVGVEGRYIHTHVYMEGGTYIHAHARTYHRGVGMKDGCGDGGGGVGVGRVDSIANGLCDQAIVPVVCVCVCRGRESG